METAELKKLIEKCEIESRKFVRRQEIARMVRVIYASEEMYESDR